MLSCAISEPCYALTPQPSHRVDSMAPYQILNSSNFSDPNTMSLAQNVERLLILSRQSSKMQISHAILVKVVLTGNPYSVEKETDDYNDLRQIRVAFHAFKPQYKWGEGNSLLFANDPHHWSSWLPPHWYDVAAHNWQRQNEIRWEEIQAYMDIEKASEMRRAAGFTDPFDRIEISQFGRKPLSYCFSSLRRPRLVRVAMLSGEVTEDLICSA